MLDEDKGRKFGHLYFNFSDDFNPLNFMCATALVDLNIELQIKLAKHNASEPPILYRLYNLSYL